MHHQTTQKATELFQNHFVMLVDMTIVLVAGIFSGKRLRGDKYHKKPTATLITTATTVKASRNAERSAAATQKESDSSILERMLNSKRVI